MLVTIEGNRRNRNHAFALAGAAAVMSVVVGWFFHPVLLSLWSLSVHLLVGSTAMRTAVEDYGTTVPRFVGTGA